MNEDIPGAPTRIGLDEIIQTITDESVRIEGSQAALVKSGLRTVPHAGELRRAEVFRQAGLFLERLRPHMGEIRKLVRGEGGQWAKRGR